MEWTYQGSPITDEQTEGYVGFVYLITHVPTGRAYVGKKKLKRKIKRAPLKGKKRKRVSTVDSDWRDYWGSNEELCLDVERLGPGQFTREIIHLCRTLGEASYLEAKEQFTREVLLKPDKFYNRWIFVKVRLEHIKSLRVSDFSGQTKS